MFKVSLTVSASKQMILPEELVRNQQRANSTTIYGKRDMIRAVPSSQLVGAQHLVKPETERSQLIESQARP